MFELSLGALLLIIFFCVGTPLNLYAIWHLRRPLTASKPSHISWSFSNSAYFHSVHSSFRQLQKHLNISNLLILLFYVPYRLAQLLSGGVWYGGWLLCPILPFICAFSFYLSSNVIVCIAVERAFNARHLKESVSSRYRRRSILILLLFAWICAAVCAAPQLYIFRQSLRFSLREFTQIVPLNITMARATQARPVVSRVTLENRSEPVCVSSWRFLVALDNENDLELNGNSLPDNSSLSFASSNRMTLEDVYYVLHLTFVFWLPAILIAICYAVVVWQVKRVLESVEKNGTSNQPNAGGGANARIVRRQSTIARFQFRTRTFRLASIFIFVYLLCWTPYNIVSVLGPEKAKSFHFLHDFIALNAVINPFLYGVMSTFFSKYLFCCFYDQISNKSNNRCNVGLKLADDVAMSGNVEEEKYMMISGDASRIFERSELSPRSSMLNQRPLTPRRDYSTSDACSYLSPRASFGAASSKSVSPPQSFASRSPSPPRTLLTPRNSTCKKRYSMVAGEHLKFEKTISKESTI